MSLAGGSSELRLSKSSQIGICDFDPLKQCLNRFNNSMHRHFASFVKPNSAKMRHDTRRSRVISRESQAVADGFAS
jgi:hypothetical protein